MPSFAELVRTLDYPMLVVTARAADGERAGCLVGFATQCSIHPPRYLVCLSKKNRTYDVAGRSTHLGVHLLGDDERSLAARFGGQTGDEVDKFAAGGWYDGPEDVPIVEGAHGWFVGRILERHDLGDHVGHLLEPVASGGADEEGQLGFQAVRDLDPGHEA